MADHGMVAAVRIMGDVCDMDVDDQQQQLVSDVVLESDPVGGRVFFVSVSFVYFLLQLIQLLIKNKPTLLSILFSVCLTRSQVT
jgi:hypothetical protein